MALTRITRGVIKPNENYDTHNIVSTGIVTSVGLDVNGNADVSGSLSVGGVLTYEDVTSIDSIGIITARSGIDADDFISVGNNIHLGNAGVITATSFVGDGSGLIGVASTDNIVTGTAATFNTYPVDINAGMTVAGVTTTTDDIIIGADNKKLKLGAGEELQLYQSGNHSIIQHNGSHFLSLRSNAFIIQDAAATKTIFYGDPNGQSSLYFNGSKKLETINGGVDITGNLQVDGFHCLGPINLDSDIDVDGHTNLDNVSIAGVSTFTGLIDADGGIKVDDYIEIFHYGGSNFIRPSNGALDIITGGSTNLAKFQPGGGVDLYFNGTKRFETENTGAIVSGILTVSQDLDVDGHTNLDNVSVAGVSTFSGILDATNTPASIRVAQDIQHKGDADTKITFPAADTISFETGGSERLRIDSSGRVLIGTTTEGSSSADTLTIAESSNSGITIRSGASNAGHIYFSDGTSGADEYRGIVFYDHASNYMAFWTNGNSERLRINSSGHVVPGADSTYDLGLTGTRWRNVYADTLYGDGSNLTGIAADKIFEGNTEVETVDTGSDGHVKITTEGSERLRIDNTGWMGAGQTSRDHIGQVAAFKNTSNANSWLSVNVNNNTGIGGVVFGDSDTWAPAYIQYNHSSNIMQFISNGSERLRIKSNGQIVLGIDGSNSELTFSQDGSTGVILSSTTTGFGGYNTFTVNSAQFVHKYGGNERLRIDSAGQVLPGTDDSQNLGSSTKRWANIYAADMHFSNEGKTNDVDGTWGDWTLQEGQDSIYMINNRTGKKYSITMKEIN